MNLDGTGQHILVSGLVSPLGIALDVAQDQMYWVDGGSFDGGNGDIRRANLDGSNEQTLVTGLDNPFGLALQVQAAPVPEPSTLLVLAIGTLGVIGWAWRRR